MDDKNVKDINANKDEPTQELDQLPPTHQAIPLPLVNQILKYLRKQPMEDVEDLVHGIGTQSVPLALQQKQPPPTGSA